MHHSATDVMESITFDQSPVAELADNNNNKKNEIYSLRQRNQRKTKGTKSKINAYDLDASSSSNNSSNCGLNYGTDDSLVLLTKNTSSNNKGKAKGNKGDKPKQKAAPLSKYRRKTANARERTRMREINSAFEHLRQCVPVSITGVETPSSNEKLTKITTLRLAMKYIRILSEILNKCDQIELTNNNNGEVSLNNNVDSIIDYQEIYNDILNDTLFKPTVTKPTGGRKELKKQNAPPPPPKVKKPSKPRKKYTKKQERFMNKIDLSPSITSITEEYPMDIGLTLESDGESLQLSEPCLSPLEQIKQWPRQDNLNNLGLLLESDGESLELSEPCLSPLSHLDSLNPFSDLLHAGFSEPSTLEMYLS
uniref:CSON004159 protein n=1 Tax=Culicoides sonorensis TaxID=179676 RepID=A0A336LDN4_CULSO